MKIQGIVFLVLSICFLSGFTLLKSPYYFMQNQEEAKKLLEGACKGYTGQKDIFVGGQECQSAIDGMELAKDSSQRDALISELRTLEKEYLVKINLTTPEQKKDLERSVSIFSEDISLTEKFIASCISSEEKAQANAFECFSAIKAMMLLLEKQQKQEQENIKNDAEQQDYYKKYFIENPKKVTELLQGRCKDIFSNQWYQLNGNAKDQECEAAFAEHKRLQKIKKDQELEKLNSIKKDEAYFIANIEITKQISTNCINGTIENIDDCTMSLKALETVEEDKNKRLEYKSYYKNHILAAKYKLKWCKTNLVKFDAHCYVVLDILKNHKDKILDEEVLKSESAYFKQNSFEAQLTLLGECADKVSDSWYYLDVNMQTERCNAAVGVIKGYN
jgi:hypothetical protein